jgi:hypothetical protein
MCDLLWRQHPNGGSIAAVSVPARRAPFLQGRGWLKINGCRARILERFEDAPERVALRIEFEAPFPWPHP